MSTILPNALKSLARASLDSSSAILLPQDTPRLPPLDEDKATDLIRRHFSTPPVDAPAISRIDFSLAFDPIAVSDKASTASVSHLDPSVLDRNMEPITLDVAPYVRSIVAYDQNLQQQRLRLSNLISEGGQRKGGPNKRMRTTRAAYSALEGGSRRTTRADRWFKAELNAYLVAKTGGSNWTDLVVDNGSATLTSSPSPTKPKGSPDALTVDDSPVSAKVTRKRGRPRKVVREDSDDDIA